MTTNKNLQQKITNLPNINNTDNEEKFDFSNENAIPFQQQTMQLETVPNNTQFDQTQTQNIYQNNTGNTQHIKLPDSLREQEEKTKNDDFQEDKVDIDFKSLLSLVGGSIDLSNRKKIHLTRKQKKQLNQKLKEMKKIIKNNDKAIQKEINKREKIQKTHTKSISQQLKERDKAISDKSLKFRNKRKKSKDVISYIGYERMFMDGICEVEPGIYSVTLEFSDISYQSARVDTQKDTFKTMCAIYDYFPPSVSIQFSVVNTQLRYDQIGSRQFFNVEAQETDTQKEDAKIFNKVLNDKMKEGISNIKRHRYITYCISAPSVELAVPRLAKIRTDITAFFSKIGCNIRQLNGKERLKTIHDLYNPETPFDFDYNKDITLIGGRTTKDAVAPMAINFAPKGSDSCYKVGDKWCQVLGFTKFGSECNDRIISDIVDLSIPATITWHVEPWGKADAILHVKRQNSLVDNEIVNEQKHSASKGRDFTVLSQEIKHNKEEFESILDDLQNNNQNLYTFTGLIHVYADTREELDNNVIQIISSARVKSVTIKGLPLQQKEALNSVLPVGLNHIENSRTFTTAQMAIFMPFATQELDEPGGSYAGQNKNSNNLVMPNRKMLSSPVGFICGKTGSGKSFFNKQEILSTILNNPNDQIIIIDRAGEYVYLTDHIGGQVINFGPDSKTYLNPFDLTNHKEKSKEYQITFKRDAMLAQASASAIQSGIGLREEDRSLIARAVEEAFENAEKKKKGSVPLLEDFHRILKNMSEPNAKTIALRYERFINGSTSFFNKHSNVSWDNRIIDINIKELPDDMLIFCLIIICEATRNLMYSNAEKGIRTWIYVEEIQSFFQYNSILNYWSRFSNEARKFGGLLTGITQNSSAILGNEDAKPIILNADYVMLLKQSPTDRLAWASLLNLSEQEVSFIDETATPGDGLLIAGASRIPITGGFPRDNKLYEIFSTDPNELEEKATKKRLSEGQKRREREQLIS